MENIRYSDQELAEFKELILEKLDKARKNYAMLYEVISHNFDDTTFKTITEGELSLSKEEASAMADRQQKFIKHLEAALVRIANKTYGICRKTGKLIPAERLRAVPHATLSVEAKTDRE